MLNDGDAPRAFCLKSVELSLDCRTLGVSSDRFWDQQPDGILVLGGKTLLKAFYLKGHNLVALRLHPLHNMSCQYELHS